jgi:DNA (cytosine-5)-methyltransferase 1
MKSDKLTFIDLFAGCGGLSEGFMSTSKYEALAHVEWEIPMVETLRNRLVKKWKHTEEDAEMRVVYFDIQKTDELINGGWNKQSIQHYGDYNHSEIQNGGLKNIVGKKTVDLIIGGPPCQAYSIAGRAQDKNSMKEDYRNYLFESFVKVVKEFQPKVFVFENVPGLLSAKPGDVPVTERIFEAFDAIGYEIRSPKSLSDSVYTASDFGVPQKRNRVIIIGVKKKSRFNLEDLYKEIDKMKKPDQIKTVKDAIGELPKLIPLRGEVIDKGKRMSHVYSSGKRIPLHDPRYHNMRDVKIFGEWISKDMNRKSNDEKIDFYNGLLGKKSNHAKYRNLEWDKPSPTIVAHLNKDGLMFIHPDENQARSITVKEAALLQSFPDDYEFLGSQGYSYKMIGNAVPPMMAKAIAQAIYKVVKTK